MHQKGVGCAGLVWVASSGKEWCEVACGDCGVIDDARSSGDSINLIILCYAII